METNKIYAEDCLATMARMPDGFIDLTVTSPPYDGLRLYSGYTFDFEPIATELYRVTKRGGVVAWIVCDQTVAGSESGTSFRQALGFKHIGFLLHDTMIWEKDTISFPCTNRYGAIFEYMFILSKGSPATVVLIRDKPNKYAGMKVHGTSRGKGGATYRKSNHLKNEVQAMGVRTNIFSIPGEKHNRSGHPAVFPERLANDHIQTWSAEGDLVYDPFAGSMTTAVAASRLNRRWIMSEISTEYCAAGERRLAQCSLL